MALWTKGVSRDKGLVGVDGREVIGSVPGLKTLVTRLYNGATTMGIRDAFCLSVRLLYRWPCLAYCMAWGKKHPAQRC